MAKNVSISQEKSRLRAFLSAGGIVLMVYFVFLFLSAVCFAIVEIVFNLYSVNHLGVFGCNWVKFFLVPGYVFTVYGDWWDLILKSIRLMIIAPVLFVPFIVPFGILSSLIIAIFTHGYSFSLWYILNYHFAKLKDVEEMGLTKGIFMVLGRFNNVVLSARPSESVMCVGEMGTGKTSSVAIPSILRSDNACIIAMDMTGLLPKYTAGYRAKLGDIVYYNWDLLDDADKGLFYPRWNPLAKDNMPKDRDNREAYLKRIASYLVDVEDCERDNYWNLIAHSIIASFLGYWVSKVEQAQTNDYFLTKLIEGASLTSEDKDVLLSYYIRMPESYTKEAIEKLKNNNLDKDSYLPVGSWAGIPEQWIGKEVCFAAITDWIIDNYMSSHDENSKDWKLWIESIVRETLFFAYDNLVLKGMKQFLYLSQRQRQLAFAYVIKPFKIFTNQAIRERTNGNDFNLDDIRGVYNEETQSWRPVTVYSLANTHASKILNQMFLDEALYRNLYMKENKGSLPVVLVLDDVGHNLRLKNLVTLLENARKYKMSALLLCNSLGLVENTYSREELEKIVINTSYKIIKAQDNQVLSRQLDKLASFATKSVQLPKSKVSKRFKKRKYYADAVYFHKLSMDFRLRRNVKVETKNHQIVLAEGYYNRPILADSIFFAEDEKFKKRAVMDADYVLSKESVEQKGFFELNTPKLSEVFSRKDLGVEDLVELDQYMNIVFDEVSIEADKNSDLNRECSKEDFDKNLKNNNESKDWWLEEDAFRVDEKTKHNPFGEKKS